MKEFFTRILEKSLWITLITSGGIILAAFLLPLTGNTYMTGGQYFWLIAMVPIGFGATIARTAMSDQIFSYRQFINEIDMFFGAIVSPIAFVIFFFLTVQALAVYESGIHFSFVLMNFAGFYIYAYMHKEEYKGEYERVSHEIAQKRDGQDRMW